MANPSLNPGSFKQTLLNRAKLKALFSVIWAILLLAINIKINTNSAKLMKCKKNLKCQKMLRNSDILLDTRLCNKLLLFLIKE
jgi:hypothetical protein